MNYNSGVIATTYLNSIFIATSYTLLTLLISSLTAYALAKYKFRGKEVMFFLLLATMMVPAELNVTPLYLIFSKMKWLNTYQVQIIHGIFAIGSTGEFAVMEPGERMRAAGIVVGAVAGRVPVFIHSGAVSTRTSIALSRHARAIGADSIAAITPFYFNASQENMEEHFTEIARSVGDDFPMYVHNIPGATNNALAIETVKKLSALPNIIGIKNSTADFTVNLELIRALPPDFDVVMGQELMFFYGLIAGVKGYISGIANAFPEVFINIYDSVKSGDLAAAKKHQETFVRISRLLYIDGKNLTYYKSALGWRGFTKSYTRKPLYRMSDEVAKRLYSDLDAFDAEIGLSGK